MWHRRLEVFLALAPMLLTGVRGQQFKMSAAPALPTLMQSDTVVQPQNSSRSPAPTSSEPPATIPSDAPIYERSDTPSSSPTSFPSLKCHDITTYRSPLNEFHCDDHAGTDCFQWRFLGLNPDEVEELIDSCPVSCDIECNSLLKFEVVLSFAMLYVDNFLAPETTEIMQEVSTDFLTKYSRALFPESRFTLYGVELRKQSIANGGTEGDQPNPDSGVRQRILRKSQENLPALAVSVAFRGFALNLNHTTVENVLREGIFSTGYSRMLLFTDDLTFRNVQVAELNETLGEAEPSPQIDATKDSSLSGGAIFACIFASFVILATGGGFVFLHQRHRQQKLESVVSFERHEFGSELNSPCSSAKSPLREVVSFDSIIRLISSGSRRSGSASPTDMEGDSTDQKSRQSKDVDSKNSSENSGKEFEEVDDHPYANLIPPMIVYDHIDLDEEPTAIDMLTEKALFKNVVPSRKVSASKLFAESLRVENCATFNESTYENVLSLSGRDQPEPKHDSVDLNTSPCWVEEDIKSLSSEDSCCTPRDYRKSFSDSNLDVPSSSSSPRRPLGACEEREQWHELSESDPSNISSPIVLPRAASVETLEKMAANGEPPKGIMGKAMKSFGGSPPWKTLAAARCNSPLPVAISNSVDALETMGTDGEMPKEKIGKATRGFGSSPWKIASVSRCTSPLLSPDKFSNLSRKSSRCSDSDHPSDQIDPGGSKGVQLVFQAPRKGKLGLVIQCLDSLGPIVTQVKDYSPLLGQVLRGDRIVDIDGMSTSGMSLRDVTGLMGGRVAQSRWAASVFRIVVWRQNEDLLRRLEDNASASGYLLSDSPVTTERHHSMVPPRSTSTPTRIRGRTPPPMLRGRGALTPPPPSIPLLGASPTRHRRSSSLNRATDRARIKSSTPPSPARRRSSSLTPRSDSREDSESRRRPL